MPTKSINMHGKRYNLSDETIRTQAAARTKATRLRKQGKVAFLNPVKRKGKPTKYYVYEALKGKRKAPTKRKVPTKRKAPVKRKGPTKSINMHRKLYKLSDETIRTQVAARTKAVRLRKQGKVAFLNPVKRKGQATKYYVYEAPKGKRKAPTKRKAPIKRKAPTKKKAPVKRKPGRPKKKLTQAQKTKLYKEAVKKTMEK